MSKDIGITVRKSENFSEWYTQVVIKAELADYTAMKGFMVCMPHGYAIWEKIREFIDREIKKTGHRNAYFPTLIPESFLKKEAEHFAGFTPEVFWVTHAGDNELTERLATRPTSETIAYDSYSRWVKSWRDLPLLLNFWNSVLRAEIKATKPFLRTSEFLWQEGHTVHATKEDADREVMQILEMYRDLVENHLAIPVLAGTKTESEKFVGALYTTTLESMMFDGKALQMGTSHNLGQNFSKPFGIKYVGTDEKEHFAWTASWGVSWRLIGGVIMVHGDDKGLVLPPKIAPIQVVIVPIFYSDEQKAKILDKVAFFGAALEKAGLSVRIDDRPQYTPGWKFNEWEMKGVPVRLELGPRDIEKNQVTAVRRDTGQKIPLSEQGLVEKVISLLEEIQNNMFKKAKSFLDEHIKTASEYESFKKIIENQGGFVRACWCSEQTCEQKIKDETGATVRALPFEKEDTFSQCIYCGKSADTVAYFARAY